MEDAFCDAVMSLKRFRGEADFKTYLFAVGKNKAVDYVRKCSKYGFVPLEDVENELCELSLLEDRVIKDEQSRELLSAMDGIKDEYRSVLYLFYFEELSYAEIARVLKKTSRQIKNLAYRARLALKGELERRGFEYEEL